jgi:CBS domain containing-hemolysin-like protein
VYFKEEIPAKGTKIEIETYRLEIKEVSSTKIERVILTTLEDH